jgi:hypothetical protein
LDVLKEDLKFWRTQAINPSGDEPPPMKIDIFLDVSELAQNQILVVVDETLRRNRVDLSSSTSSSNSGSGVDRILLETWILTLKYVFMRQDFAFSYHGQLIMVRPYINYLF